MGSNAQTPRSPDFSNIVSNVTDAANTALGWGKTGWDWATGQITNLNPALKSVSDLAGQLSTGAGALTNKLVQQYGMIDPTLQKQIDVANNWDSPEQIRRRQAESAAQTANATQAASAQAKDNLISYGVKPQDAKFLSLDTPLKMNQIATTVAQNNAIRNAAPQEAGQLRQGVINTGLQQAGLANQTTGTALTAGMTPLSAGSSVLGAAAPYLAPGPYLNTALTGFLGTGQMTSQNYANQLQAFNEQQAANSKGSGLGTALGIAGSIAGSYFGGPIGGMAGGALGRAAGNAAGSGFTFAGGGAVEGGRAANDDYAQVHGHRAGPVMGPAGGGVLGPGVGRPYAGGDMVNPGVNGYPVAAMGGMVPPGMSPSGGAVTDDIPAVINDAQGRPAGRAQINDGEFIFSAPAVREIGVDKLRKMHQKAVAAAEGGDHPHMQGRRPAAQSGGASFDDGGVIQMGGQRARPFSQAA